MNKIRRIEKLEQSLQSVKVYPGMEALYYDSTDLQLERFYEGTEELMQKHKASLKEIGL